MTNDTKAEKGDAMQEAMSRSIPAKSVPTADDKMTEAMSENRQGAHKAKVDEDRQTRSMSNEFELDEGADGADKMTEAMSEKRKNAKD